MVKKIENLKNIHMTSDEKINTLTLYLGVRGLTWGLIGGFFYLISPTIWSVPFSLIFIIWSGAWLGRIGAQSQITLLWLRACFTWPITSRQDFTLILVEFLDFTFSYIINISQSTTTYWISKLFVNLFL